MKHLLSLPVFPLLLVAQQGVVGTLPQPGPAAPGAVQAAATKPGDLCAIEGRVLNAATGEPLKKANLTLRRTDVTPNMMTPPTSYGTSTDEGGGFAMKDLDPGKYRLYVNRTGFVSTEYGARGPMRQGATLSLDPGQRLQGLAFRLTPHAVITGRVVDEDGEPVANVQVQTMRYRYSNGRKQLAPFGGASTNDLGEYRIFGLAPGRYYLSATYRSNAAFEPSVDRSANQAPEEGYVPAYYPGTTDPASAAAIDVPPGGQLRGMDLKLSKTRTVRVRGHVQNLSGSGRSITQVMLTPRDSMGYFGMTRPVVSPTQGDFEIRGVSPGAYILVASVSDSGKHFAARQPLDVGNSNVENVIITIPPNMEVTGQVRVEGDKPPDVSNVRISLRPREQGQIMFGPMSSGRVNDGGGFVLSNVSPDNYNVAVTGLPDGYYVKSAAMGQDDILDAGVNLSRGAGGALSIVLSPGAGQVDGAVVNAEQQPAPAATVVLAPKDANRRDQMQSYKTTTTDQYGRFTLKSLDPGEYKLFAWEDVEYGAYMDPDFMKPVEDKGFSVTIQENSHESAQLKLIPAEDARQNDPGRATANR